MNTATKFVQLADKQAKVKGTYYGIPFSGVCKSSRKVIKKDELFTRELTILLTATMPVFGETLTVLAIWANEVDSGIHFVEEDFGEK